MTSKLWPELPYEEWVDTRDTLHRWLQIIGKVLVTKSRWVNHSWHTALYVNATGLSTAVVHDSDKSFDLNLNFIEHFLNIRCSDGTGKQLHFKNESVASFYNRFIGALQELGIAAKIYEKPNELLDATPFPMDETHCSYDPFFANRYWQVL
ncbi:MAG: DUF5996 family protein, partial [Bdellovibrionia bacterium]